MATDRSHLPANERLAIVETETKEMKRVVGEIRDAVVGIRAAMERMAVVEERQVALRERHESLCKRVGRSEQRMEMAESRMTRTENQVTQNSAARGWLERLSVPFLSGLIGAVLMAWKAGIIG